MKSIIPYMLSASLMLAGSAVLAGSETSVSACKSSHTAVTHKKAPSFLFVVHYIFLFIELSLLIVIL